MITATKQWLGLDVMQDIQKYGADKMKLKLGRLLLLGFLALSGAESVYGESVKDYAFTIEFLKFPEGATRMGEPFVLSFSNPQDLVDKAYAKCGMYHGMYFIQPIHKMMAYSVVAQCFIRGNEA